MTSQYKLSNCWNSEALSLRLAGGKYVFGMHTMESTMQEVTKPRTMSGIIRELDMALTASNTYELFGIRVINASGHSTQLVTNIVSFAEASLFLLYNVYTVVQVHYKSFCLFGDINYYLLCCQSYSMPSARRISVKPYMWGAVMLLSWFYQVHLMFSWIPYLTVASHILGQGQQLLCRFLQLLGLMPFNLAGSFLCKIRCLHWNASSLLPRALTDTWWKHLPLTLTCYEVERSLNQSPGEKGCLSLETLILGAAVGSRCTPPRTAKCRSTCLANAFAVLPWNHSSIKPAVSHPNEWDFWMKRGLQSQYQRTVIWQMSRSGRGQSELWASKNKACVHTFAFLSRFSEQRSLSCQNHIVLLASSHFSLSDILWGLSSTPSGKRPCRTSKPQGWGCRSCLGPHRAGRRRGLCHDRRGLLDEGPQILLQEVVSYRNWYWLFRNQVHCIYLFWLQGALSEGTQPLQQCYYAWWIIQ